MITNNPFSALSETVPTIAMQSFIIAMGALVILGTLVFMPLFLAHRWKGKKLKDYTLSEENIRKMREKADEF